MATFTNQASLSYNGILTNSNVITGELQAVLTAYKSAIGSTYAANGDVTYLISINNTGTTPFTNLTITDDLGAYSGPLGTTLVPLQYVADSVTFLVNGVPQAVVPTVTPGQPLTFTEVNIPASSYAVLAYETRVTQFAPLDTQSSITNNASITGPGLVNPVNITQTIDASDLPSLSITKALSPTVVAENGQLTYTFTIQNAGNSPAEAADNVILTDQFDPILDPISVTFNGTPWTSPANYSYNTVTGLFTTAEGAITVPAATYTQDTATGAWIINPGVSTLVVTGTVAS